MSRRDFCFVVVAIAVSSHADAQEATRPNIVHIIVDDLGWNDVGFHGGDIKTPAIDQLATESVVLDRFYVTPICSPTRAGVLTGRYPFRFGIWGGVVSPTQRHGLPPREVTMPELLADAGYEDRIMLGKWHLGLASTKFHPLNHGFTEFYGHYNGAIDYFSRERFGQLDWHRNLNSVHEEGYSTDLVGDAAVDFFQQRDGNSPFYMFVAFNAPHSPIQAKREDLDANGFNPEGNRAPNTDKGIAKREKAHDYGKSGKGNTVRQTFSAMVTSLDQNVAKILQALDRNGLEDNTIVVFHSDNGGIPKHGGDNTPLRGNKFTMWEGGVRVVAMIRWPAKLQGGTKYEPVAAYVDIVPTLAAAAGISDVQQADGINLLPCLVGKQPTPERAILLGEATVVTDQRKLKDGQYFNLHADPNETSPVVTPPEYVSAYLKNQLKRFAEMQGPKCVSSLPKPESWPPAEWQLPLEPTVKVTR